MKITHVKKFIEDHGVIYVNGFSWFVYAKQLVLKNPEVLISAKWCDKFRSTHMELYPLNIHREAVYSNCVKGTLCVFDNKVCIQIDLYDGSMIDGYPRHKRCVFIVHINKVTPEIRDVINEAAFTVAERQYAEEKEKEYNELITSKAKLLLYA